jgi:hypothetical protein
MQVQQIINQMIALSAKKYEELAVLKNLSEKQLASFGEQKLDAVEYLLNEKDKIIHYIRKLDDAFLRAYDTLKEELRIESLDMISDMQVEGVKELKDLIRKITEIIESVISLERNSYGNASKIKNTISEKIKEINAGKKMTNAYNVKPLRTPSYFIDKKK